MVQSSGAHSCRLSQASSLALPLSICLLRATIPPAARPQLPPSFLLYISGSSSVTHRGFTCMQTEKTGSWPLSQTHWLRTCGVEPSNLHFKGAPHGHSRARRARLAWQEDTLASAWMLSRVVGAKQGTAERRGPHPGQPLLCGLVETASSQE